MFLELVEKTKGQWKNFEEDGCWPSQVDDFAEYGFSHDFIAPINIRKILPHNAQSPQMRALWWFYYGTILPELGDQEAPCGTA